MFEKNASAIYTDPPYNIALNYDKGIGGKGRYGGKVDDAKTDADYRELLRKALLNGLSACHPDAHVFMYCDQRYIWLLQTLYVELSIAPKRVCLDQEQQHANASGCLQQTI
jgi:DNA modification methylase